MIVHTDSFRYLWEVLEGNEYSFLFNDFRVLDLGCNVGAFTLWIYPKIERLWAVDMNQGHIDNLNKTIKDNGMQSVTTITERVTDLATLMSGHAIDRVDILKMDIEGDEYEVLSKDNFPTQKITTIIGEYHRGYVGDRLSILGYDCKDLPNSHFLARRRL